MIAGGGGFAGRDRDEREVSNYYKAADKAETVASLKRPFREHDIQVLHGLTHAGRPKPSSYRDGQNVIRDSADGGIVYMPPEAKDVPVLMQELVEWINKEMIDKNIPMPIIAALAHYQFATIHPYYDGNGRTARLLTTMILQRGGYGLKGVYSLEEYYAKNLQGYYAALDVGDSHNYYLSRVGANVLGFVEYFCVGMADACTKVRRHAESSIAPMAASPLQPQTVHLTRNLHPLQRQSLGLFASSKTITAADLSQYLGLQQRQVRELCAKWVEEGFLVINNPSKKARSYQLANKYEVVVG